MGTKAVGYEAPQTVQDERGRYAARFHHLQLLLAHSSPVHPIRIFHNIGEAQMITEWLLLVSLWCKADPYPFKSIPQCRQQLTECVKAGSNYDEKSKCFGPVEDLAWPEWSKEKVR